uniref:ATS domain-containing protein n=1 Tax=Caenorhabditis tropicalis TaxID=1561998 RepID=A0A1I7UC82_9PELO
MGDTNSADLKTIENRYTSSSIDNVERKMVCFGVGTPGDPSIPFQLLLKIAESEKSHFDDSMNENEWDNCWKETENSVSQTEEEETKRIVPDEWIDQYPNDSFPINHQLQPIQSAPHSYYELMDLNGEQVENTVRMARVPSQYQLDALSEMFIFDVPQNYLVRPTTENPNSTNIMSTDQVGISNVEEWTTPYYVNSEYVSELLS